jgi:hypothetical protein
MRLSLILLFALSVTGARAHWFGSDTPRLSHLSSHLSAIPTSLPAYSQWSNDDLKKWLKDHNIEAPSTYSQTQLQDIVKSHWNSASAWTADQYNKAQEHFQDIRDSSFDTWDDSRLRDFLLKQGVVAPSGPREQLVSLAKEKYNTYTNAASSFSSQASASASTAIYGDTSYQASQSLSSVIAQATKDAARSFDDSKDYVYSTWDDNKLRSYLEDKGVLKTKAQKTREELLATMRDAYAKVANPVWSAWSDSYMVRLFPRPYPHSMRS